MNHLTIGIFGNLDLMKKLGKQGTMNDIIIYNHASSDGVFTYVAPTTEKIAPLLQVMNMIDVPVVCGELTKELGEQLVALDAFGFDKGFILAGEDVKSIVKTTNLRLEEVADEKELAEKIRDLKIERNDSAVFAPIDNYFSVKSVGTVVLSVVKGGSVKKYDKLMIQPLGKEIIVKSMQSQDKDIEEASQGMRAGINIKGIDAKDLQRGYALCKDVIVKDKLEIEFTKSKYAKDELADQVFVSIGLQVVTGTVSGPEGTTIILEKPVVLLPSSKCIIASTKQIMPRIIGTAVVKE